MKKDTSIEFFRGLAIIAVILVHTTGYFTYVNYGSRQILLAFIDTFANIGVPLFVFISGFILAKKYSKDLDLWEFYKKRALRIIPLYLIYSFIYMFAMNFRHLYDLTPTVIINNVLTGQSASHLPYLVLVLELYIIFPLIMKINTKILLYSSLIIQILAYIFYQGGVLMFPLSLFYFSLGIYFAKNGKKLTREIYTLPIFPLVLAALNTYLWINGILRFGSFASVAKGYLVSSAIIRTAMYTIIITKIYQLKEKIEKNDFKLKKFFVKLGNLSFGIYLIHMLFILALAEFVFHRNYSHPLFIPLSFIISFVASFYIMDIYLKIKRKLLS